MMPVHAAHADERSEARAQMIRALTQRRDAACAKLQELVEGEDSEASCSSPESPLQYHPRRPRSVDVPDAPSYSWTERAAGDEPQRPSQPKDHRPHTAMQLRPTDPAVLKSRHRKSREAEPERQPQAQRKGMLSLFVSTLYNAVARPSTSKAATPETGPHAPPNGEGERKPPAEQQLRSSQRSKPKDIRAEPQRPRAQDPHSRSFDHHHHGRQLFNSDQSQSFTYGQRATLCKKKSPAELQEELLALFGVAKESGAVVEVDGYESPPARSPARSPVDREAPANFPSRSRTKKAGSIQPFRASQQAAAHSRDAFYER